MGSKLFSAVGKRYKNAKTKQTEYEVSKYSTRTIISEIFELTDKNFKNTSKINMYMHELKQRGSDAIFEYYCKYVRRVIEDEKDLSEINVYYALNEVIKLNEAEKIWNFVNLLQDLQENNKFKINYDKCSLAIAKTGNATFNLYWAECYPNFNQPNIEVVLKSNDAYKVARMLSLVENLSDEQISKAVSIVKSSKNKEAKKELKAVIAEKDLAV